MNKQEKQLVVMAHALAHQENEIQYLKALLVEKVKNPPASWEAFKI